MSKEGLGNGQAWERAQGETSPSAQQQPGGLGSDWHWAMFLDHLFGRCLKFVLHTAKPCGAPAPWLFHGMYHGEYAWGLSWVVLGMFVANLSHLAGIYCLVEAILANLADST